VLSDVWKGSELPVCCGEPAILCLPGDVKTAKYRAKEIKCRQCSGMGVIVYVGTDPTGSSGVCHC